eukprot:5686670-Pleurochrysis_carterae.AAC.1
MALLHGCEVGVSADVLVPLALERGLGGRVDARVAREAKVLEVRRALELEELGKGVGAAVADLVRLRGESGRRR